MKIRSSIAAFAVVFFVIFVVFAVVGNGSGSQRPVVAAAVDPFVVPVPATGDPIDPIVIGLDGLGEAAAAWAWGVATVDAALRHADEMRALAVVEAPAVELEPDPVQGHTGALVSQSWGTAMEPCGGDLPPCWVKNRESRGDYSARNASGACGAWQVMPGTWNGYGGYVSACDAPPAVQDEKARELWAGGAGCSHWNAC